MNGVLAMFDPPGVSAGRMYDRLALVPPAFILGLVVLPVRVAE
jgi:hypothetical protein